MRRRPLALACAGLGLLAAPAAAQDAGLTRDPGQARAWVAAHTGIDPSTLAILGPGYLFAASPSGDGAFVLREEVTSPTVAAALGGRSATARLTVDCALHQSGVGDVRVFADNDLKGEAAPMKAAAWMRAAPIALFDLTAALCGAPGSGPPASAPPPPGAPEPSAPQAPAPEAAAPEAAAPQAVLPEPAQSASAAPNAAAPSAAPASPHWMQLGAFDSEALAGSEWTKAQGASPALAGLDHRIDPVRRGASQLYRLLAGPFPRARPPTPPAPASAAAAGPAWRAEGE